MDLFPDIGLDEAKFSIVRRMSLTSPFSTLSLSPSPPLPLSLSIDSNTWAWPDDYWKQVKNRRRYFEAFAREKKFDPLVAENWYSISDELSSAKVPTLLPPPSYSPLSLYLIPSFFWQIESELTSISIRRKYYLGARASIPRGRVWHEEIRSTYVRMERRGRKEKRAGVERRREEIFFDFFNRDVLEVYWK